MISLVLYSGPHCRLCEEARDMVYQTLAYGTYQLDEVDVTGSLETKKAYGLRIPVLKNRQTGEELQWPFYQADLMQLVND